MASGIVCSAMTKSDVELRNDDFSAVQTQLISSLAWQRQPDSADLLSAKIKTAHVSQARVETAACDGP